MVFRAFILFVSLSFVALAKVQVPTSCPQGEHWVRAHHRRAYIRADGTHVKATNVRAHCRKNQRGYEFWNPKLKPGFPQGWLRQDEKSKPWTEEEKERVLEALESIPEYLWKKIEGIYRMGKDSSGSGNPGASENEKIALYDSAFSNKYTLAHVLAHEMAHEVYRKMDKGEVADYAAAAEWEPNQVFGGTFYRRLRDKKKFVRKNGWGGIHEDFSDNIEFYIFNPQKLKETAPKVYEWIKKNNGDKLTTIRSRQ